MKKSKRREKKRRNITLSSSSINSNLSLSRSSWMRYAFKARQRVRKEKIQKGGGEKRREQRSKHVEIHFLNFTTWPTAELRRGARGLPALGLELERSAVLNRDLRGLVHVWVEVETCVWE